MALEPFELNDREWNDVLTVINQQVTARGLAGNFDSFTEVLKKDWFIITEKPNRDRLILHNQHTVLDKQVVDQTDNLATTTANRDRLPPDPGPPDPGLSP